MRSLVLLVFAILILTIVIGCGKKPEPTADIMWHFLYGCRNNDITKVSMLLSKYDNDSLLSEFDKNGYTPLHIAISNGNCEMEKLIIDHGASLEKSTIDPPGYIAETHYTPLILAANSSKPTKLAMVKLLIEKGTNINKVSGQGFTAMQIGVIDGDTSLVEYLISKGADVNTHGEYMGSMTMSNRVAKTETGIEMDLIVIEKNPTALMLAEAYNDKKMVALLKEHGAK